MIPLPLLFVFSLAAPFLLWPIEYFLPYPYLIEELFKAGIVRYLPPAISFRTVLFLALIFSLSESIFYLFNFLALGSLHGLGYRLLFTSALHLLTFSLLFLGKKRLFLALPLSILIHYLFNLFVSALPR